MNTVERPILFSGEMVRAILEDRKTQTRRVIPMGLSKSKQKIGFESFPEFARVDYPIEGWPRISLPIRHPEDKLKLKPEECGCERFGAPWAKGDRLWVREAWRVQSWQNGSGEYRLQLAYLDDAWEWLQVSAEDYQHVIHETKGLWNKKRLGRFMPRWASRITLEITDLRVQRLQEISEEDAKAEGVEPGEFDDNHWVRAHPYAATYWNLWDSINAEREKGAYAWAKNPWVWVLSFKRIKP